VLRSGVGKGECLFWCGVRVVVWAGEFTPGRIAWPGVSMLAMVRGCWTDRLVATRLAGWATDGVFGGMGLAVGFRTL
jgi:hypothetical protein